MSVGVRLCGHPLHLHCPGVAFNPASAPRESVAVQLVTPEVGLGGPMPIARRQAKSAWDPKPTSAKKTAPDAATLGESGSGAFRHML